MQCWSYAVQYAVVYAWPMQDGAVCSKRRWSCALKITGNITLTQQSTKYLAENLELQPTLWLHGQSAELRCDLLALGQSELYAVQAVCSASCTLQHMDCLWQLYAVLVSYGGQIVCNAKSYISFPAPATNKTRIKQRCPILLGSTSGRSCSFGANNQTKPIICSSCSNPRTANLELS